jgi:hypothetical protein
MGKIQRKTVQFQVTISSKIEQQETPPRHNKHYQQKQVKKIFVYHILI